MIIVVMGVAGSGKTTVGSARAAAVGWPFHDADAFHPPANVQKMARGEPLTDADRAPWLATLHALLVDAAARGAGAVLACSALKASYRRALVGDPPVAAPVRFVYLRGTPELLRARLHARTGHFVNESLLASQLATLEEPRVAAAGDDDTALTVDVADPPPVIVARIRAALGV